MTKYDTDYLEALLKNNKELRKKNRELKYHIEELIRFEEESRK